MKKLFVMLMMVTMGVMTAGCNTVKGFGQDMQKAGESLERAGNK